jgi:hypothetical protein
MGISAYTFVFCLLTTHDGWASAAGTSATINIIFEGAIAIKKKDLGSRVQKADNIPFSAGWRMLKGLLRTLDAGRICCV